jgi:hypothetical protein
LDHFLHARGLYQNKCPCGEVMVTSDTKFTKGSASVTLKGLQVGDRVVIHAMPLKGGMLMAHTVQIGDAKMR